MRSVVPSLETLTMLGAEEQQMPSPDALLPPQMAAKAETVGESKANLNAISTFVLAVLAGAFIAWGGVFFTTVVTSGGALPFGLTRLLGGLVFSLGLILVIVGGAELFTGNNLIVMAWASGRISWQQVLRNWLIVYAGNFAGAAGIAVYVLNWTPGLLCSSLSKLVADYRHRGEIKVILST